MIERRSLPPRVTSALYGARPAADEIRMIAAELGDVPREATESWQDLFHFLRRKKSELQRLADRVDFESNTPAPVMIRSAKTALRGRPRMPRHSPEQLRLC